MYTGAGSGPLMAAATAWSNLAAELSTTASSWESIIGTLTGEHGRVRGRQRRRPRPSLTSTWLTTTAAAAEQAGAQASASAAAYEAAFHGGRWTPPVIAANRSLLAALVATNFLGINTAGDHGHRGPVRRVVGPGRDHDGHLLGRLGGDRGLHRFPAAPTASPAAAGIQSRGFGGFANATARRRRRAWRIPAT